MLPPTSTHNVKVPLLRILQFLSDLKSTILTFTFISSFLKPHTYQVRKSLYISQKNRLSTFLSLRAFSLLISSTFIHYLILMEIYMNANIMKTQISQFIKYVRP